MSDTLDGMRRVFDEALALAERKNHDYGDAWRNQGWRGNLSRIFEKDNRLRTLLWNGNAPEARVRDEDVRQTAIDMINTLSFFVMNLEQGVEWGHEMPFHNVRVLADPSLEGFDGPPGEYSYNSYRPDDAILAKVHSGLTATTPTESIPKVFTEPTDQQSGELPVRDPGGSLNENEMLAADSALPDPRPAVKTETKPSPVRRQPNRK